MTHQAYGPRVGVPRILSMLAEYELPASFFVPGLTAELHPGAVEEILAAGHEVGHHSYAHRPAARQSLEEERSDFERGLVALDKLGVRPQGHRAAGWEASWQTASLVAEHGLTYDSSLMDDDRPYRLRTPAGSIAELPVHWSLDDWEQYAFLPDPAIGHVIEDPAKVRAMWIAEIDAMARHGCLLVLTCHPFLSGRPSRIESLRGVIEHALERGDVEFAAAREVADRARVDLDLPERELKPLEVDPDVYPEL
jgi:peptidoglycan/xylan/chitin deacetylase (PgdA/CDA1 family)